MPQNTKVIPRTQRLFSFATVGRNPAGNGSVNWACNLYYLEDGLGPDAYIVSHAGEEENVNEADIRWEAIDFEDVDEIDLMIDELESEIDSELMEAVKISEKYFPGREKHITITNVEDAGIQLLVKKIFRNHSLE